MQPRFGSMTAVSSVLGERSISVSRSGPMRVPRSRNRWQVEQVASTNIFRPRSGSPYMVEHGAVLGHRLADLFDGGRPAQQAFDLLPAGLDGPDRRAARRASWRPSSWDRP